MVAIGGDDHGRGSLRGYRAAEIPQQLVVEVVLVLRVACGSFARPEVNQRIERRFIEPAAAFALERAGLGDDIAEDGAGLAGGFDNADRDGLGLPFRAWVVAAGCFRCGRRGIHVVFEASDDFLSAFGRLVRLGCGGLRRLGIGFNHPMGLPFAVWAKSRCAELRVQFFAWHRSILSRKAPAGTMTGGA